jgi:LPXTG-motif cell wall-anchored protein
MRRARALGLGLLLALPWLGPAALGGAGGTACAADRPHAALLVDTGGHTTTYCVGLDAGSVSGLHVIQLAAAQYGLTYRLGFGGQAVCQLNGVGSASGDCFGEYPSFWGYWHGDGHGGWTWAGSGAGSSSIGDGDVEGWSWGQGDSGTTHPAPPHQRYEDVCDTSSLTPAPSATPSPTHAASSHPSPTKAPSPAGTGSTPSSDGTPSAQAASAHPHTATSSPPKPTASSTDTIVRAQAAAGQVPSSGGPPAGALLAIGAIALLGAGGWLMLRRRREAPGP